MNEKPLEVKSTVFALCRARELCQKPATNYVTQTIRLLSCRGFRCSGLTTARDTAADTQRSEVSLHLCITTILVGQGFPGVEDLLSSRFCIDLSGQELALDGVQLHLLVFLVVRDGNVQHEVRIVQAGLDCAQIVLCSGFAHARVCPELEIGEV